MLISPLPPAPEFLADIERSQKMHGNPPSPPFPLFEEKKSQKGGGISMKSTVCKKNNRSTSTAIKVVQRYSVTEIYKPGRIFNKH